MVDDIEVELQAIKTIREALEPLNASVRTRVLDYVFQNLGITIPSSRSVERTAALPAGPALIAQLPAVHAAPSLPAVTVTDVHTLTEQKQPTTASQMIAVVGYYLMHHAPEAERQSFLTVDDIQKYFVQARYPLPEVPSMALVHAKNAGYLDVVEKGKYKLNSVGHNLVAHKMPKDASGSAPSPRKRTAKKPAKANKSKKTVKKAKR